MQRTIMIFTVLTGMFCASMEAMVTATLMPSILASMEGFDLYPWVGASYLLSSLVTTPLYGMMGDVYGYRRMYRVAIICFLMGSLLCGLSTSMPMLIVARAVQGLGSAGLITLSVVLFGVIFSIEKRAKMQGMIAATWAVSSLLGPPIGAFCAEVLSWRWAFLMNVPAALVIFACVSLFEPTGREEDPNKKVDYQGAWLFSLSTIAAVILFLNLGKMNVGPEQLLLGLLCAVVGVVLKDYLDRQKHPIIPVHLMRSPSMAVAIAMFAMGGAILFSLINFLPLFVQGVMGLPPRAAGYAVTIIAVGTFVGSLGAGLMLNRFGFRNLSTCGALVMVMGFVALIWVLKAPRVSHLMACNVLIGVGLAMMANVNIVLIQGLAPKERLGAASSMFHFFRMFGGTAGIALLGGIQLGVFHQYVNQRVDRLWLDEDVALVIDSPQRLFEASLRSEVPQETLQLLVNGLSQSIIAIFVFGLLAGGISLWLALQLPDMTPKELSKEHL